MSGGEPQMLSMGRALMMRSKALMLDKIVEMACSGLTVMLVEQNAARALEISDRGR